MRRLLPLLSILFALAVGIALGAGPLDDDRGEAATRPRASTTADDGYDAAFAAAVAPTLYARGLAGQSVAVVTTPGVSDSLVKALTDQVVAAGGTVTGRTRLTAALTAPGQKTLVDTMGSQLATQLATQAPALGDASLTTYPRMGRLVGLALATTTTAGPPGTAASTVRESLLAAKLTSDPGTAPVAPLVLLVLGSNLDDTIVTGLVEGLAAQAHGVVVAGGTGSEDVARVAAADTPVATVDGVERPAGRVAAVLALVRQVTGGGGSFGASGIDGAVPLG